MFGKETLLLVWAIEDCDPSIIPVAIRNWLGLSPEERWWLFTMTNASSGGLNDKYGWRKAIRYALTENPVEEKINSKICLIYYLKRKTKGYKRGIKLSSNAFIEVQFPVSKVSKESYKERKSVQGQTLTGLGKWWGRKPLFLFEQRY